MTSLDLSRPGGVAVEPCSDRGLGGGRVSRRAEIDAAERDYLNRERWLDEAYDEIAEEW